VLRLVHGAIDKMWRAGCRVSGERGWDQFVGRTRQERSRRRWRKPRRGDGSPKYQPTRTREKPRNNLLTQTGDRTCSALQTREEIRIRRVSAKARRGGEECSVMSQS